MGAASRAEVEDLVQETLLSLHAKRATYDRSRPFTAWFFSIARYKLIDHYRGRGARMRGEVVSINFGDSWGNYTLNTEGKLVGQQTISDNLANAAVDLYE